ncbi:MAG: M56 family metallopeptidase [Chitinophagaceae bacterium]
MAAIGQSTLLQALGWAVFNSLWQMALLWIAYQFFVSVFRITRSPQRSTLAALLLFAGFAWFVFTFAIAATDAAAGGEGYAGFFHTGNTVLADSMNTLLPAASVLYLILLVFPVLNFVRNYRYVQVIRRYGLSRAGVEWRMFVQKIAAGMGIRRPVHIWMSELITSPVTVGYIRPIILLPLAAVNHLNPSQIEAVLLHELSHIRRNDYFINLLTRLVQTLLYFNPFVKAFIRIIGREREKSCDETVMQFQYEPHGYATALLVLEKAAHVPKHSLTVAASDGKKSEFRQRIEWILGIRPKPVFSFTRLAGVIAALLCFAGLNAILILKNPAGVTGGTDYSYARLPLAYEFLGDDYDKNVNASIAENATSPVVNHISPQEQAPAGAAVAATLPGEQEDIVEELPAAHDQQYAYISHVQDVVPQLNAAEELQVQKALEESKKVIGEIKWKEMEFTIADVMTTTEKEQVKDVYVQKFTNADWQKMGDKLRIAYDRIDWPVINEQLNYALAGIRLDSLQQVYTVALSNLSSLQKEMTKENQPAIPDTDITIQSIETKKVQLQKAIDKIRVVRPKKIVRL